MKWINVTDGAKARPIKTAPVLHLKINQQPQYGQHDCGGQNLFSVHRRMGLVTDDSSDKLYGTASTVN
jgi:hypothetical protein